MRVAKYILSVNIRATLAKSLVMLLYGIALLLIWGAVKLHPGPKKPCYNFHLCHWNLNSITANNFSKIYLILEAYNVKHKFDMICISKTYLYSSFLDDDSRLNLPGYNVVRAVNPNNTKKTVFMSTLKSNSMFVR